MVTVLSDTGLSEHPESPKDALWLDHSALEPTTGWQLKAEGLCRADSCVPITAKAREQLTEGNRINVSGLWDHLSRPIAHTDQGDVWALGEAADVRNDALLSLEAPDFTLPDFDGKLHSLSDFRRQRVLLITWASW